MENRIFQDDYVNILSNIEHNSVDLILTDPPYGISRKTNFTNTKVSKFLKMSMDFGDWDKEIKLETLASLSYNILRKGGTAIIWYDIWKINYLAEAFKECGFSHFRAIFWDKINPVPINSKIGYLSNSREMAVVCVKGGGATFNSIYDKGVYSYSIPSGTTRVHPTQKPLGLFNELVLKHSNENDLVCDPFLGSGTTVIASIFQNRRFVGGDISESYVDLTKQRIREQLL